MEAHDFTKAVRDVLRKRRLVGHRITTSTGRTEGKTQTFMTVIGDVKDGQADEIKRAVDALRHRSSIKVRDGGPFVTIEVTWYV